MFSAFNYHYITHSLIESFHFKAKRVEELYIALERKNMDIYIKRSQRLYSNSPGPQPLMTLTVTGAEISALADPSMNGTKNIVKLMRDIDTARLVCWHLVLVHYLLKVVI